jgi:hypothetical protein
MLIWYCVCIYSGTFSKRSKMLNGRNPIAQDHELLNYDYDSEAEWEEDEGEGEDIAASDNEDDDEGDELEYDDFFVRDNDYGMDYDSDGEELAAVAMKKREGEERVGPRFIRGTFFVDPVLPRAEADQVDGTQSITRPRAGYRLELGCAVKCDDKEKDVVRLSSYAAVMLHSTSFLPRLGLAPEFAAESTEASSSSSSSKKKSSKKKDDASETPVEPSDDGAEGDTEKDKEKEKDKAPKVLDEAGVSKKYLYSLT